MENPIVDVLIPTFRPDPKHLKEALDGLLAQSFQGWQAFIHDDASDTDVASIVKPYLEDPRITFERSEINRGIGGNWNACFQKSDLPIVAYLFQDDIWDPNYLEKSVSILNDNPSVGLVSINHTYKLEEGVETPEDYTVLESIKKQKLSAGFHEGRKYLNEWIEDGLWPNLIGEPDFVVMRRVAMNKAGQFKETMPQLLDAEYWVRMLLETDMYYCPEKLGEFRVHAFAASAQNRKRGKALFDRFKTLDELIARMPKGAERKAALKAQVKQFQMMAEKYHTKRDRGDNIKLNGVGCIKGFCVRHPIVTLQTLVKTMRNQ